MLNRILWALAFTLLGSQAWAVDCQYNTTQPTIQSQQFIILQCDTNGNLRITGTGTAGSVTSNVTQFGGNNVATGTGTGGVGVPRVTVSSDSSSTATSSGAITAPPSTLTSGTATAITATNNLIASSTTAGSIVVPSFAIANAGGGGLTPKFNLTTSATSGWGAASVYVNLYSAAPTYANGDGGVWSPTVTTGAWLDQYTCTFTQFVTNAQAICVPVNGTVSVLKLASGTAIYWDVVSQSTVTKASGQTFTITDFLLN